MFAGILFADGTFFALIAFAAAALHELGHLIAAAAAHIPIRSVDIFPLGAVITLGEPCPYRADVAVKLAGGAANLAVAVACVFIRAKLDLVGATDAALLFFILCNFALAGFNLLPIRTLDGGEALYSLLCIRLDPDAASKITRAASVCALLPLWIVSGYILFYTGYNFTLLLLCGWLFFSAVLECSPNG